MIETSIIVPVKNMQMYIVDFISEIKKFERYDFELIVVDDNSKDNTIKIATESLKDARFNYSVYKNESVGKVAALNLGFSKSNGQIIKLVDADDILLEIFFDVVDELRSSDQYSACLHDAFIVNKNLQNRIEFNLPKKYIDMNFNETVDAFKSVPRWAWTMKRELASEVFPIPEELPFEDLWFSLVIKKTREKFFLSNKRCYLYRQHERQTYGGVLNYERSIIEFRNQRFIIYCNWILNNSDFIDQDLELIKSVKKRKILHKAIIDGFSLEVLSSSAKYVFQFLIFRYFYKLIPILKRIQWKRKW